MDGFLKHKQCTKEGEVREVHIEKNFEAPKTKFYNI